MKTPNGRRTAWTLALAAGIVSSCAWAGAPVRTAFEESISQDGKATFTNSGTVEIENVHANAAMLATALAGMQVASATALKIDGVVQTVVVRRTFPAGSAGSTAKTDMMFSIQVCRKVERDPRNQNDLICADQPAAIPRFALEKLVLAQGQSATARFPGGIMWTYKVGDAGADR